MAARFRTIPGAIVAFAIALALTAACDPEHSEEQAAPPTEPDPDAGDTSDESIIACDTQDLVPPQAIIRWREVGGGNLATLDHPLLTLEIENATTRALFVQPTCRLRARGEYRAAKLLPQIVRAGTTALAECDLEMFGIDLLDLSVAGYVSADARVTDPGDPYPEFAYAPTVGVHQATDAEGNRVTLAYGDRVRRVHFASGDLRHVELVPTIHHRAGRLPEAAARIRLLAVIEGGAGNADVGWVNGMPEAPR